jgi:hypothetical protein
MFLSFFTGPLFAGKTVTLDGLFRPHIIAVDNEQVYIVDDFTIYIYSLKNFKLIKKFGKEGEGPREFKDRIYSIDISSEHLLVNSEGRVSHFSKNGNFIKQANATSTSINYLPIGDGLVGMRMLAVDRTLYFAIDLLDKKLNKIKEIYRFKHPFRPRKPINPTDVRVCSYHVYDNKIFIDKEGGIIDVYDKKGGRLYSIDPGIEKIKITDAYKKKYMDSWKSNHVLRAEYNALKNRFKFPAYFSPIRNFQIIDGKIHILTYKEWWAPATDRARRGIPAKSHNLDKKTKFSPDNSREREAGSEMLIYSLEGKLLKKASAPLTDVSVLLPQVYNFYTIKNGKVYKLIEDFDNETWDLHISEF